MGPEFADIAQRYNGSAWRFASPAIKEEAAFDEKLTRRHAYYVQYYPNPLATQHTRATALDDDDKITYYLNFHITHKTSDVRNKQYIRVY
jgi:hypothetical protein